MPVLAPRKRRAMSAGKPTRSQSGGGESTDNTSDLKGLTEAVGLGFDATGPARDPLLGSKIHDVTIVSVLAEGGMGRVYRGLQDKPRRAVAVKVIRPGSASPEAMRRFESESELLGRLSHPHVAHVYAAGIHPLPGGQVPYFVMEYIADALPLTVYVQDRSLSRAAILGLFCKVCEAVAYGHDQYPAVVHRDLKPSNILVDRAGNPKVIDFGIAKCLAAAPEANVDRTTTGQIIGSVQYMSPEQFGGDPDAIGPATDVYALGVILCELLTGKPPYDVRGLNIVEAARLVCCESDHRLPVEVTENLGQDLVAIVERCLRQQRTERFATAGHLAVAISNYLVGLPVMPPRAQDLRPSLSRKPTRDLFAGRRAMVLVAMVGVAAAATAIIGFRRGIGPTEGPFAPSKAFTFNSHRYEIIWGPMTRAGAVAAAQQRGGRLVSIDTAAELRAIVKAAVAGGPGLVYLWADRGAGLVGAGGNVGSFNALAIMPPVAEWSQVDASVFVGGFICEWDRD